MANSQARALPPEKLLIPLNARRQASCKMSSASVRSPASQRASASASSRWGKTTRSNLALSSSPFNDPPREDSKNVDSQFNVFIPDPREDKYLFYGEFPRPRLGLLDCQTVDVPIEPAALAICLPWCRSRMPVAKPGEGLLASMTANFGPGCLLNGERIAGSTCLVKLATGR